MAADKLKRILQHIDLFETAHKLRRSGMLDRADAYVRDSGLMGGAGYRQGFRLFMDNEPVAGKLFPNARRPNWNFARARANDMLRPPELPWRVPDRGQGTLLL